MYLTSLELNGFKSFGKKSRIDFTTPVTAIVGPNGSGKSNTAESFRFVLGEQSMKSLRGRRGEDLIWSGSSEVPRSNRASVKLTFNNTKRLLNVDFDEVVLERVVYRDGTNEYLINGSKVRLKDIAELLAGANVGSSGHHIISQGEADRVLAASPRERKQMIEDALGLRVYQYKREESMKKLEKTEEHARQVEALRKESAPHLAFLERQVRKLEKARELRGELSGAYREYLRREHVYLAGEREAIAGAREEPTHLLKAVVARIATIRKELAEADASDHERAKVLELERSLAVARRDHAEYVRSVGRIEGQLSFEERQLEAERRRAAEGEGQPVPYREVSALWEELIRILDHAQAQENEQHQAIRDALHEAQATLRKFVERHAPLAVEVDTSACDELRATLAHTEREVARTAEQVAEFEAKLRSESDALERATQAGREGERALFAALNEQTELQARLARLDVRARELERADEEFKREVSEGIALIGRDVLGYRDAAPDTPLDLDASGDDERRAQADRRRALEKLKIRLEEVGGSSADEVVREHRDAKERDDFLARELADLEKSAEALRTLIDDLGRELSEKFAAGITAIGAQFSSFFTLMFGGGSAKLTTLGGNKGVMRALLDEFTGAAEEAPQEEGIEIEVSLPKKRVQNLAMLSGGERTLTSIALIFAISQVNPPPFIILDETDAALDEANSRRYGDMIESLAAKSQLILITHNRETMSRAGVLYGITMGLDGVSKVLSVKFEEAAAVAK